MKYSLTFAILSIGILGKTYAQTESSAFTQTGRAVSTPFATDYHCLGINPANLDLPSAFEGKSFTMGFMELGASFYSEAFSKPEVRQNVFSEEIESLSQADQVLLATEFANSVNSADIDIMTMGFAKQTQGFGSFGFSVRDRIDFYSKMGDQLSDIIWLGYSSPYFNELVLNNGDTIANYQNMSQDTLDMIVQGLATLGNAKSIADLADGTEFRLSWLREFNLGWGKQFVDGENMDLYAGIGLKLLIGQGMMSLIAENGTAEAFSALSPIFDINYGTAISESNLPEDSKPLTKVGFGYGVDLGTTIILKDKFILSAAVTDIGKVQWDGNVYTLKDFDLTTFENEGLENIDFLDQIEQLNGGDGILDWKGEQKISTNLATTLRLGAGVNFNEKFKAGIDFIAPVSDGIGQYDKAVIAAGGEVSPVKWLHLQMGFITGGNYDFKIPAGVVFSIGNGTYEFGMASRDMITFFSDKQPTVSASMGFLRFRF
jgi:hypothetical protein